MNTTKITLMIVAVAATMMILAPSLSTTPADAKKESHCTNGSSSHECSGNSGNIPGGHTTCTAGKKGTNHPNCAGT
ncbi:MAG: hypothetical protein WBP64_13965 [Nitrososphaeraceae archaeon]